MRTLLTVLGFFIITITTQQADASEYGCTVLLCLANPVSNGGPRGVAECVAPINRLYEDLLRGHPFPGCDQSDGNDGNSSAKQVFDYYDRCQPPLSVAPAGSYVVQGVRSSAQSGQLPINSYRYQLSGTPQITEAPAGATSRACVANHMGSFIASRNRNVSYPVDVYSTVQWMKPQSPRAIDVYVAGQFYQRVRY